MQPVSPSPQQYSVPLPFWGYFGFSDLQDPNLPYLSQPHVITLLYLVKQTEMLLFALIQVTYLMFGSPSSLDVSRMTVTLLEISHFSISPVPLKV